MKPYETTIAQAYVQAALIRSIKPGSALQHDVDNHGLCSETHHAPQCFMSSFEAGPACCCFTYVSNGSMRHLPVTGVASAWVPVSKRLVGANVPREHILPRHLHLLPHRQSYPGTAWIESLRELSDHCCTACHTCNCCCCAGPAGTKCCVHTQGIGLPDVGVVLGTVCQVRPKLLQRVAGAGLGCCACCKHGDDTLLLGCVHMEVRALNVLQMLHATCHCCSCCGTD